MFLFKNKIAIFDYCDIKFNHITSPDREVVWLQLIDDCDDTVLNLVNEETYFNNLRAVNLQFLSIALARNTNSAIMFKMYSLWDVYYKANGFDEIDRLKTEYNKVFGSSHTDGVKLMLEIFFKKITGNYESISDNAVGFYYEAFYIMLKSIFEDFKKNKIVL